MTVTFKASASHPHNAAKHGVNSGNTPGKTCDFSRQDWYAGLSPQARAFLDETPEEVLLGEDDNEVVGVSIGAQKGDGKEPKR